MHIHIYPKLVNLLHNPRHALSSMIGKGLFTLLSDLGFPLDWHAQTPSCSRHYRQVHGVEVDEALFYGYHAGPRHDGDSLHCSDLKESRSLSFDNAQHAIVQGQDVVLFSDTVLGTARTLTLTLFNPLEYPVLVRLAASPATREIAGFLPSNRSESIAIDPEAVLEGTIPSNGRLVLGPLTFTPTNLGVFSEYFMLFNNYTGLQPRIPFFFVLFSSSTRRAMRRAAHSHRRRGRSSQRGFSGFSFSWVASHGLLRLFDHARSQIRPARLSEHQNLPQSGAASAARRDRAALQCFDAHSRRRAHAARARAASPRRGHAVAVCVGETAVFGRGRAIGRDSVRRNSVFGHVRVRGASDGRDCDE